MKHILIMVIFAAVIFTFPKTSAAELPVIVKPLTVTQTISSFALAYNVSEKNLLAVSKCESGLDPTEWNKLDPHGGSKGIFQFQKSTFLKYAKILNINNPNIWNVEQQAQIAAYMFSIHQQNQWWNCWHKVKDEV